MSKHPSSRTLPGTLPGTLNDEYQEFLRAEESTPPQVLSETITRRVRADLSPSFLKLFVKLGVVHAFVGSLSLLVCPQFGIAPFGNHGLMAVYMQFGAHACLAACGATFMMGSALIASLVLRPEELRALRKKESLQILGLGLGSLAVFLTFGEVPALTLAVAWLIGGAISGLAALELGFYVRALWFK
ncbi:MAG: hypothetical protein A2428_17020 [Bdellovibrionales bacterium RIFOXYC1_FULL_54_43]|nr:MAG: hypothetical protein A2428_17020 [Bdellovibrionales bacterium RIFOXYC1_FULL_54_43]OFZ80268.1 MAG: hypothetical protein A2603_03640 [Bdellovibrionales bacterium RIFOXYD1_FULL_55_31]